MSLVSSNKFPRAHPHRAAAVCPSAMAFTMRVRTPVACAACVTTIATRPTMRARAAKPAVQRSSLMQPHCGLRSLCSSFSGVCLASARGTLIYPFNHAFARIIKLGSTGKRLRVTFTWRLLRKARPRLPLGGSMHESPADHLDCHPWLTLGLSARCSAWLRYLQDSET